MLNKAGHLRSGIFRDVDVVVVVAVISVVFNSNVDDFDSGFRILGAPR